MNCKIVTKVWKACFDLPYLFVRIRWFSLLLLSVSDVKRNSIPNCLCYPGNDQWISGRVWVLRNLGSTKRGYWAVVESDARSNGCCFRCLGPQACFCSRMWLSRSRTSGHFTAVGADAAVPSDNRLIFCSIALRLTQILPSFVVAVWFCVAAAAWWLRHLLRVSAADACGTGGRFARGWPVGAWDLLLFAATRRDAAGPASPAAYVTGLREGVQMPMHPLKELKPN